MKLTRIVVFVLLLTFALGVFMVDIWDPDFWWHLATGKWIVEHGKLPDEDPFSFTTLQKDPFAPVNRVKFILTQYWLAQVVLYKIYSLWGLAGISIFRALILTLTSGIIMLILRYHKVHPVFILPLAALSILVLKANTGERPQLFSFLFAALILYLLERHRSNSRREEGYPPLPPFSKKRLGGLYALPFLMALWSNLHGGFIYGVVIIGIYIFSGWVEILLGRVRGKEDLPVKSHTLFTAIGMIAILATVINPNTYHTISDQFRYQPTVYFMNIQEMQPTYKFYQERAGYFVMLILLTVVMLIDAIRHKRVDINHLSLFLFNALLSMSAVRFVPFFIISGSFLLGIYLKPYLPLKEFEKRKWLEGVFLLTIALAIAAYSFFVEGISIRNLYRTGVNYSLYPYGSANFLKTLPPGKLFNPYTWGGYLIWTLYPEHPVFIDGRGLNQEIFLEYNEVEKMSSSEKFAGMPKWKGILDGYNVDYLILAPLMEFSSDWSLINTLAADQDWQLIYADDFSLIYVRKKKEFSDVINRYRLPSDLAYATTAWQAVQKAKGETVKGKKLEYYLVAADSFMKMDKVENARYSLNKAHEIDPENSAVKEYGKAIGMKFDDKK
ncbi:MAG TPA: hypothetical protein VEE82_00430 [Thermodesulfovibrionales bacterium]|nr:hypothetical protein [Thermodesulfovibrionales bacterium]